MQENASLTTPQRRFITACLSGKTKLDAAKQAGVNEATVYRWLRHPHFQQAFEQAQAEAFKDALSVLRDGTKTALHTCLSIMTDKAVHASVRLRAAQGWLDQAIAIFRTAEVEQRLAMLEEEIERYRSGQ